jgi:serine/threonine-protein kinase
MTALRPEPARRYASAQALADDLQAWLDGRPVRARPDTFTYRLRTFVRGNPLASASMAVAAVAVLGGR